MSRGPCPEVGANKLREVSNTEPLLSSATWHSVQPPPYCGRSTIFWPATQLAPPSSEYITKDPPTFSQQSWRSATSSLPAWGPRRSAMPLASELP